MFFFVALPAAMLQAPFFATDRPPTLNFGALGGLLAHQMTHHLDRRGAEHRSAKEEENDDKESDDKRHHYHPNTFLQRWWTEETMSRWAEAADCFRAQYGSIEDPETGMMVKLKSKSFDKNLINLINSQLSYQSIAERQSDAGRGHRRRRGHSPGLVRLVAPGQLSMASPSTGAVSKAPKVAADGGLHR